MPLCGGTKTVQRKIVLLGDGACGKTSLINVFTRGYFPTVYEPTVFENYVHDIFVDNVHIELSLWDTAGQEEFDRLRSLSYDNTHTIMLCFTIDEDNSLDNARTKWLVEIRESCPAAKLVLIALKCDLRPKVTEVGQMDISEDEEKKREKLEKGKIVSYLQGKVAAESMGALRYIECSAKENQGVNEAFTEAARVALTVNDDSNSKRRSGCCVM